MTAEITHEAIHQRAVELVEQETARLGTGRWWQSPLMVSASIDERFNALPDIAADDHYRPVDLLASAKSVIVFFIPFTPELVRGNTKGERPSRNWGQAYVETNALIGRIGRELGNLLESEGFESGLTPATHNFNEIKLMARWSHKHLAYLAGLGRFGVHHMLITPAGCAGRFGSLVTEADLGNHPIIETEEACLVKAGHECGKCIEACPVGALSETGFDRRRCWDRLLENQKTLNDFSDLPASTHVCGKCAAGMPCSFKNPVADLNLPGRPSAVDAERLAGHQIGGV